MRTTKRHDPPKRIVALFPELLGIGGIQEAGRLTAVAIHQIARKRGWCAEFLTLNDPVGLRRLSWDETVISFRGFSRRKLNFALAALQLAANGTRIVVVGHPHLAFPAAPMKIINRRIRTVAISHGVETWNPLPWARRVAFSRSDLFLAPSLYTAQQVAEAQGVPPGKIRRVAWPLSPDVLRMAESTKQPCVPRGFPEGLIVLAVTRLATAERYKGVDKLIEAIAQIRRIIQNLHLVVVGSGDDLERHVRLAAEQGIANCVHFYESLSREEIAACYSHCDVFAMPSTGEGFGLVFLEAMAFGKPLIGADAGGTPDLIEDGANGFLVRGPSIERLCDVLTSLLTNERTRAILGQKSAQLARTKYRFENFLAQLESIFCDCGLESDS